MGICPDPCHYRGGATSPGTAATGWDILDEKQVEVWSRALATRWRGNDESWQLFEPYVRDVLAIIDTPGIAEKARHAATKVAADAAARYVHTHPRTTPAAVRAAVLDLLVPQPAPVVQLAAAAE